MNPTHTVLLEFAHHLNAIAKGKKLSQGLSVVVQIGDSLWVANDETISLERLTLTGTNVAGGYASGKGHTQFSLNDYLNLPVPPTADPEELAEIDLEGLAYEDGYLWLVGSHSQKRKQAKCAGETVKDIKRLAKVESDGNRYLLARVPVEEKEGSFTLAKKNRLNGNRLTAAQLNGGKHSNDLMDALDQDNHLQPFFALPGKDNGFDIEGLAVANGHLFIGLRGPVLRGWAIILEVVPKEDKEDSARLKLKPISPDGRLYRKHFLQLDGLGLRDLCVQGDDLLILAGPTMVLDGPVVVYRWLNGAKPAAESLVPSGELQRLFEIPYGQGDDHAEGMALFTPPDASQAASVLVVYDSAARSRQIGQNDMLADVFSLP